MNALRALRTALEAFGHARRQLQAGPGARQGLGGAAQPAVLLRRVYWKDSAADLFSRLGITLEDQPVPESGCCRHEHRTLPRRREVWGGQIQYWVQCTTCGGVVGSAVAKSVALELTGGQPEPFDEQLESRSARERRAQYEAALAQKKQASVQTPARTSAPESARERYERRMKQADWPRVRHMALTRAGFVCEHCREQWALEVHHKTYERLGYELPADLMALCKACHCLFDPRRARYG